jgi:LPS-assembly lipoprotein
MSSPDRAARQGAPPGRAPPLGRARFRAALLGLGLVVGLTACAGYRPLYAVAPTEGTAPAGRTIGDALRRVSVERIAERPGQMLREKLIERLATGTADVPDAERWPLRVTLRESRRDLGIRSDASATRARLSVTATITLADPDGTIALNRTLTIITSYSILDDRFATLAAERDARERALDDLADQIRTQLALYFARPPAPDEAATGDAGTDDAETDGDDPA